MAKKKKTKGQEDVGIQSGAGTVNDAGNAGGATGAPAVPEIPDVPAIPDVPPPPPAGGAMPPPPPTGAMKALDLPPVHGSPDAAKGVLKGILERSKDEVNNEAAALMGALKVQQDAARLAREEEDRRRAAEGRARVEEERRKREAALKEYEARQRQKEEAAKPRAQAQTTSMPAEKKGGRGWIFGVVAAVLVVGGAVVWFTMPRVEPVVFATDSNLERARGGMILSAPVAWGADTLRSARTPDPEMLVAAVVPAVYEPAAPVQAVKKGNGGTPKNKKLIEIKTGIIGGNRGKKVTR